MIGFVDLGDINNRLLAFEKSVHDEVVPNVLASSVMVVMVKGVFTPIRFAYAQFPCSSMTWDLLFQPFWEAVFRLERMDFKVGLLYYFIEFLIRFREVLLMVHQPIDVLSHFMIERTSYSIRCQTFMQVTRDNCTFSRIHLI